MLCRASTTTTKRFVGEPQESILSNLPRTTDKQAKHTCITQQTNDPNRMRRFFCLHRPVRETNGKTYFSQDVFNIFVLKRLHIGGWCPHHVVRPGVRGVGGRSQRMYCSLKAYQRIARSVSDIAQKRILPHMSIWKILTFTREM